MSACVQFRQNFLGLGSRESENGDFRWPLPGNPQLPSGYKQVPARHLEIAAEALSKVIDKYGQSRIRLRWQRGEAQHYARGWPDGSLLLAVPKVQTVEHLYTFLHECGHALLPGHLDGTVSENQAEYEAAQWALDAMARENIEVSVRFHREIQKYIAPLIRRDMKHGVEIDDRAAEFVGDFLKQKSNPLRFANCLTAMKARHAAPCPPYRLSTGTAKRNLVFAPSPVLRYDIHVIRRSGRPVSVGMSEGVTEYAAVQAFKQLHPEFGSGVKLVARRLNPGVPGAAFKRCVAAVEARGSAYSPRGVCATAGRKKYGKKRFQEMAAAGRHTKRANLTDRALRYRANVEPPSGPKQCAFCGSKKQIQVGHVNGREEDTSPENLIWTCRSCNVLAANRMRKAGVGRLTVQYNPADAAKSLGQWLTAVLSMKGESDAMTVPAAVAMIRATPASTRSRFASEIWDRRRSRGNPSPVDTALEWIRTDRTGVAQDIERLGLTGAAQYSARLAKERVADGDERWKGITVKAMREALRREFRRGNPATAATEAYQEFHGHSPDETVEVTKQVHFHKHLAAAGQLRKLVVKGVDGQLHTISRFDGALLAFNEKKNQLFVEGGDQSINLEDFGISKPHELETLGKVIDLDYHTDKSHLGSEGGKAVYAHRFRTTNQDGQHVTVTVARYPDLIYRVRDEQLEFSGGSYQIKAEGIDR